MQRLTAHAEALAPVAACMLEEARIAPGQRVLDVGSGGGDMAMLAAEAAGPSGFVLATDISRERMAGLTERVDASSRPRTIGLLESAAEDLALEPATFDVALARNCVMYFRDLGRALVNVRRALRAGGRLVTSVYGPLAREPFHAIPIEAVTNRQSPAEPAPDYIQAFRVGAEDLLRALIKAGFTDARTRVIQVQRTYPDLAAALAGMRQSRSLGELMAVLPLAQREDAWTEMADRFRRYQDATNLRVPGEQVILVGTA